MEPVVVPGQFVFTHAVNTDSLSHVDPFASVVEPEGLFLVLRREQAGEVVFPTTS